MRLEDWRTATIDELVPCYAAEHRRWRDTLNWDTTANWHAVEAARHAGTLPGFVARDDRGDVCGWSFHLLHRGELQVGSIVASSDGVTTALVTETLESSEARDAEQWRAFGWFDAPGFDEVLATRKTSRERYCYLEAPLPQAPPDVSIASPIRPWDAADEGALALLLESSYGGADAMRPFASQGSQDEWREYASKLIHTAGCGNFDRTLSLVVPVVDALEGAAIITRLTPVTAHLAQLSVRPAAQSRGLGRRLLETAMRRAANAGCTSMTLLVRAENQSARRLYDHLGFRQRASFVSASAAF